MFKLAFASLWNRRGSAVLTMLAIAISVSLLLGVERVREQTRQNFANTVSGTDIIVGARTGQVQLLLSSVFHIGSMTNTLSGESYAYLRDLPEVQWHIPIALGDSVKGAPVVATSNAFFDHFQYGNKTALTFAAGESFAADTEVVVGAQVASEQQLRVGENITLSHGSGGISFSDHDEQPFTVVGVLARTGTPVDKAVYVPLAGLALLHGETVGSAETDNHTHDHDHGHEPHASNGATAEQSLSAVLLGLQAKPLALRLQRDINTYAGEPLTAIMPGMTLQQLWKTLNIFEQTLAAIATLVVVTGLLGMLTALLSSLRERRREMAVLRAVGAGPSHVFALLMSEALLLTVLGCGIGVGVLYIAQISVATLFASHLGIQLTLTGLSATEWQLLALVVGASLVMSIIPAWRAYKLSLADGLTVKL